jgi:hypothetical protein
MDPKVVGEVLLDRLVGGLREALDSPEGAG